MASPWPLARSSGKKLLSNPASSNEVLNFVGIFFDENMKGSDKEGEFT